MKEKLLAYEKILMQEPAIVTSFLNLQIPKPTFPNKLAQITGVVRAVLHRRYSGPMAAPTPAIQEPADTPFSAMFQPNVSAFRGDEVDDYLAYGAMNSSKFIDVLKRWSARIAHYRRSTQWPWTAWELRRHQPHRSASTARWVANSRAHGSRYHHRFSSRRRACDRGWTRAS
jgi:hypothetical protein